VSARKLEELFLRLSGNPSLLLILIG